MIIITTPHMVSPGYTCMSLLSIMLDSNARLSSDSNFSWSDCFIIFRLLKCECLHYPPGQQKNDCTLWQLWHDPLVGLDLPVITKPMTSITITTKLRTVLEGEIGGGLYCNIYVKMFWQRFLNQNFVQN